MDNDVSTVNDNGETPLILAAREGNLRKVKDLVVNGAQLNQSNDDEKHTPLHDAAAFGHLVVIQYLVEAGADMEREDYYGSTPLLRAAQEGHAQCVEYLLDMHAKEKSYGETAMLQASSNGHLNVVQLLVERGSDPNEINNEGHVALHEACWFGHLNIVRYLITHGAEPNRRDDRGDTPLLDASTRGHLSVVEYLITTIEVDFNQTNENGVTPLLAAANAGHVKVVEFLVESGCEVERRNRQGHTALWKAAALGHMDVLKYLITREHGDDAVVSLLLDHGADVDGKPLLSEHKTAIESKVDDGWIEIGGVDDVVRSKTETETLREGQVEEGVEKELEGEGVKVDTVLKLSNTATSENDLGVELPTDTTITPPSTVISPPSSPLHSAVLGNHYEVVMTLLHRGARLHTVDRQGRSLLDIAFRQDIREAILAEDTLRRDHGLKRAVSMEKEAGQGLGDELGINEEEEEGDDEEDDDDDDEDDDNL